MDFIPHEIIRKKRDGKALDSSDIELFWKGFQNNIVTDYQMSAMLMAILLRGMERRETVDLTNVMLHSGAIFKWGLPAELIVDKHSTGGVGDKTSLIIAPLCAEDGLFVPMIAGRGLGHTGGTLDKLESIPGFNVFLDFNLAKKLVEQNGAIIIGQSKDIAPLDKRLYSLRDVTATVESIPLITASILSKKLAEGISNLVMDVKFGSGAFMSEREDAEKLARSIFEVGSAAGVKVSCFLTSMNMPLGKSAGNTLEILECLGVLRGSGPKLTRELSLKLSTRMVKLAKPNEDEAEIEKRLAGYLDSGKVFERFKKIAASQGADVSYLDQPKKFRRAKIKKDVIADRTGFVSKIDVRELGVALIYLGAGRRKTEDVINPAGGLSQLKNIGDKISKGESLCVIEGDDDASIALAEKVISKAYVVGEDSKQEDIIWKVF